MAFGGWWRTPPPSFTPERGDLVLIGTPAGVGAFRTPPVALRPGDGVEIEGIGTLRNAVAAGE